MNLILIFHSFSLNRSVCNNFLLTISGRAKTFCKEKEVSKNEKSIKWQIRTFLVLPFTIMCEVKLKNRRADWTPFTVRLIWTSWTVLRRNHHPGWVTSQTCVCDHLRGFSLKLQNGISEILLDLYMFCFCFVNCMLVLFYFLCAVQL